MITVIVIWVIVATVGTIVAFGLWRASLSDRADLRAAGIVNGRAVIADAVIRSATVRLFVFITWLGVGLLALAPHLGFYPYPVTAVLLRGGLILGAVAYLFDGIAESRVRAALLRAEEKEGG